LTEEVVGSPLQGHSGFNPYPQQVDISNDGNRIAVSLNGGIIFFNIRSKAIDSRVCEVAIGALTKEEWNRFENHRYIPHCMEKLSMSGSSDSISIFWTGKP
jgi:hypothetical protein